jgi:hypothetical protein
MRTDGVVKALWQPIVNRNAATFDNRPHRAERQDAASMRGDNYLLPGFRVSPLLMAAGLPDQPETFASEEAHHLV